MLEPIGKALEIGGKTVKRAYRIRIPIGPDGDVVSAVADVNTRGVGMHHLKSRIGGLQTAGELFALLAVQRGGTCSDHAGLLS